MKTMILPRAVAAASVVALLLLGASFAFAEESTSTDPIISEVISESEATSSDIFVAHDTALIAPVTPATETSTDAVTTSSETAPAGESPADEVSESTEAATSSETEEAASPSPELSTGKDDYQPGEIVTLFGSFFAPMKDFVVRMFGNSEVGDFFADISSTITTDENGDFTLTQLLDNFYRPVYDVTVTDSESGEIVAETQFTDAPNASVDDFSQCANDDGDGYSGNPGTCNWTNGNMNGSNSTYQEEDATVQRLLLTGLANGSHVVTIEYDTTKGGKHAYDFLTDPDLSENWVTTADVCSGLTNFSSCASATVNQSPNIPHDPLNTSGTVDTNQNIHIRNGAITSISAPSLISGSYAADSTTRINVTFTVNTATCLNGSGNGNNAECPALLTWGAHISSQADWGSNNSAVNISGSPYHVRVTALDGKATGNRDNQMSASVIPGTLTIIKDANPNSAQDFTFTTTGTGLSNFSLDDDTDVTLSHTRTFTVDEGSYTVTEGAVGGWSLTNLICVDPTTNSTVNLGTRSASINVAAGENVTCTFTNTLQQGSIKIVKNTVGGDGTFAFTGNTGVTSLTTSAGTAQQTVSVNAGTYNISETVPTGWDLTSATCDNNSTPTNITVTAGQTTTCTFTNTKKGSITIEKQVVGTDKGFSFTGAFAATLSDNLTATLPVVPGSYSVTEGADAAYALTSLVCNDSNSTGDTTTRTASFVVSAGENVTCVFTNSELPKLTLVKTVTNDNGGTAVTTDFQGKINGNNVPWASAQTLTAGSFTASEINLPNYTAGSWSGDCAADGSITLAYGDNKTCTINNNDNAPSLTLVKEVVNDNGGTAVAANWTLTAAGYDSASPDAGTYNLSESGPAGYTQTSLTCSDTGSTQVTSVTLGLGENVTCTFVNNDQPGALIVKKILTQDDGGDEVVTDFSFKVNDGTATAFEVDGQNDLTVSAGTYSVIEPAVAGYTTTYDNCSNLVIPNGGTATCTVTNNDQPGTLKVTKITDPVSDTTTLFDITANADGEGEVQGIAAQTIVGGQTVTYTVDEGVYDVSEADETGWVETANTCNDIAVPNGGEGTCTITNVKLATVIIVKDVIGNPDPTDFTFNNNFGLNHPDTFLLDEDTNATLLSSQSFAVLPGTYLVSESALANWQLEDLDCNDSDSTEDLPNRNATIVAAAGETVTCTFTNEELVSITLVKNTLGGNGDFDFVGTGAGLPADIELTTVGGTASLTFTGLDQDNEFSITETVPAGWALTLAICTAGETPDDIDIEPGENITCTFTNGKLPTLTLEKTVINDHNGQATEDSFTPSIDTTATTWDTPLTLAVGAHTASETTLDTYTASVWGGNCAANGTITLTYGENKTCTITNDDKPGTLIVKKVVINDNGGSAAASDFTFKVNDGTATAFEVDGQNDLTVSAGTYSVIEPAVAGYTTTYDNCSNLVIPNGGTATCTVTNDDQQAFITVTKVVTNDNGGSAAPNDFLLTLEGNGVSSGVAVPVNPGTYTAAETQLSGYTFEGFTGACDQAGDVTVALGESKTCTLTNNDQQAYVIVDKTVVNNNGGSAGPNDFLLTVDGGATLDGAAVPVNPGTHQAGETQLSGYTASAWGGDCSGAGSVTVALGQTKTCTITNDDQQAYIVVDKTVVNDDGGTAAPDDFLLKVDTTAASDGIAVPVNPGAHKVSETLLTGYTAGDWGTDCDAVGNVTIALGQTKTCTITNTDNTPTLKLVKTVTTDNGGNEVADDWTLTAVAADPNDDRNISTSGGSDDFSPVFASASYTLGETGPAGYTAGEWSCEGGILQGSTLTVALGEQVTCTIVNDDIAPSITLIKEVVTNNGGTAGPNDFGLTIGGTTAVSGTTYDVAANTEIALNETGLTGYAFVDITGDAKCPVVLGGTVTLDEDEHITCTIKNDDQAPKLTLIKTVTNNNGGTADAEDWVLSAAGYNAQSPQIGSYNLSESDGPDGYALTSLTCSNATGQVTSVTLGLGDDVTCTFVNDDIAPKLTLVKQVTNNNGGTAMAANWTLTAAGYSTQSPQTGTYALSESNGPAGYTQTSLTCSNSGTDQVTSVTLGLGDDVTCTFVNDDIAPSLTLNKIVINDNTGSALESAFTLTANGGTAGTLTGPGAAGSADVVSGSTFKAGIYALSETGPAGYKASAWSCVKNGGVAVNGASVTLGLGDVVTCSITNDDLQPTRTQGFWQTHTNFTSSIFALPGMQKWIGENVVVSATTHKGQITNTLTAGQSHLFGAFYSAIATKANGQKRTATDKTRMTLLQQLMAAKLNCAMTTCNATTLTLIANADLAYKNGTNAMGTFTTQLDAFNNSGDAAPLPSGLGAQGSATPDRSQLFANKSFWDTP